MLDYLLLACLLALVFVCFIVVVEWVVSGRLDLAQVPPLVACLGIALLVLGSFTTIMVLGRDALASQGEALLAEQRGRLALVGTAADRYEPFRVECGSSGCTFLQQSRECMGLLSNVTRARRMLGEAGARLAEPERLLKRCCLYDVLDERRERVGNVTVTRVSFGCNATDREEVARLLGGGANATKRLA